MNGDKRLGGRAADATMREAQAGARAPETAAALREAVGRLGRRSPLRRTVEGYCDGLIRAPELADVLAAAFSARSSMRWRSIEAAARCLGLLALDPESAERADQALSGLALTCEWTHHGGQHLLTTGQMAGVIALVSYLHSHGDGWGALGIGAAAFAFLFILLLPVSMALDDYRLQRVRCACVEAVAIQGGLSALSTVASVIRGTIGARRAVNSALLRGKCLRALHGLLRRARDDEWALVAVNVSSALCPVLDFADTPLAVDILHVLRITGDGAALPAVERLARRHHDRAVRAEAAGLLPLLQERRQRELASGLLLRASEAPSAAPAELLRAPTHTAAEEQRLLLRGVTGDDAA